MGIIRSEEGIKCSKVATSKLQNIENRKQKFQEETNKEIPSL